MTGNWKKHPVEVGRIPSVGDRFPQTVSVTDLSVDEPRQLKHSDTVLQTELCPPKIHVLKL